VGSRQSSILASSVRRGSGVIPQDPSGRAFRLARLTGVDRAREINSNRGKVAAPHDAGGGASAIPEANGFFFFLVLFYLFLEYGRPAQQYRMAMIISILSFVGWVVRKQKRWTFQNTGFVAFLALMVIGTPLASNNYWAFWETYGMVVVLGSICVPLPSLVTSVRRTRIWINTFVVIAVYVGSWAILHGGNGPSAGDGGQDENYVAAMMAMAIPFAYFSILAETRLIRKVQFALAILVFCGAVVAANNASRGGFIGICAVLL
jgi:hypothetical protein